MSILQTENSEMQIPPKIKPHESKIKTKHEKYATLQNWFYKNNQMNPSIKEHRSTRPIENLQAIQTWTHKQGFARRWKMWANRESIRVLKTHKHRSPRQSLDNSKQKSDHVNKIVAKTKYKHIWSSENIYLFEKYMMRKSIRKEMAQCTSSNCRNNSAVMQKSTLSCEWETLVET